MSSVPRSTSDLEPRDTDVESFVPKPTNTRLLRNALGCFGTGVTIVTVDTDAGPIGMTVNSFSSVSLDPPLIQWAVAKDAGRYQPFADATQFTVSLLRLEHKQLAYDFSKDAEAFDAEHWSLIDDQPPRLNNALASFRCDREELYDGGDHTIIIGKVLDGTFSDGTPLLFYKGKFGHFSAL